MPWVSDFIFCKPELFVKFGVNVNALDGAGKGPFLDDILLPEYWFVQLMDTQSLQDGHHRDNGTCFGSLSEEDCSLTAKGKAKEEGT